MKELEKYSLSDLFHIKQYVEKKLEDAPSYDGQYQRSQEDYKMYREEYDKWKDENSALVISSIQVKYEIEDRMKIIMENIEKEFYNA